MKISYYVECFLAKNLVSSFCTPIVSVVGILEDRIRNETFVDLGQRIYLINKQAVFSRQYCN